MEHEIQKALAKASNAKIYEHKKHCFLTGGQLTYYYTDYSPHYFTSPERARYAIFEKEIKIKVLDHFEAINCKPLV